MPEIQQKFQFLKDYLDQIPVGLMLFDQNKKLLSWNKYALVILEQSEEDFKKDNFGILSNQMHEALEVKSGSEKDLIGLSKPLKAKKVVTEDNNIILMISETYQEAIGEMSHELRRPITNIKTLTESLLLGAKNEPEVAQKFLEQINFEVDRLTKLVNELLNLSKIRSGKLTQAKKKIDLKIKVDDAIKLLQPALDKNKTKIKNEIPAGYQIYADSEQIDHVLQNLIENAIKYSNEGSQITIKPGPVQGSFEVIDTGIGIAPNEIPKIFDRFYRVDRTRSKGSSGLGLSIVKNVVDLHGGKIEVKSVISQGSSFLIILPFN